MRVSEKTPLQTAVFAWSAARKDYHCSEGGTEEAARLDRAEDRLRQMEAAYMDILDGLREILPVLHRVSRDEFDDDESRRGLAYSALLYGKGAIAKAEGLEADDD